MVFLIEHDTNSVIIVNLSNNKHINSATDLCHGVYIDDITGQGFCVQNGRLQGIAENKIAALAQKTA